VQVRPDFSLRQRENVARIFMRFEYTQCHSRFGSKYLFYSEGVLMVFSYASLIPEVILHQAIRDVGLNWIGEGGSNAAFQDMIPLSA
jgi:hypothetical protein